MTTTVTWLLAASASASFVAIMLKFVYHYGVNVGLRAGELVRAQLLAMGQRQGYLAANVVRRARAGDLMSMAILKKIGQSARRDDPPIADRAIYDLILAERKGDGDLLRALDWREPS